MLYKLNCKYMRKVLFLFFVAYSLICGAQIVGDGTFENPYIISSADDLFYMRDMVNSGDESYKKAHYKQMDNIVINESMLNDDVISWVPINSFNGVYDGGRFYIKGLYINNNFDNQGLFGVNYGTIKNLGLIDSYVSANNNVGGIAGYNYGEIDYCYNDSHINGVQFVGGICGVNRMYVKCCYNLGNIECEYDYVGGITAQNLILPDENGIELDKSAVISDCYNAGTILGGEWSGGISVVENFSTLINCYNIGTVVRGYPVAPQYYNSENLYYDCQCVVSKFTDNRAEKKRTKDMTGNILFDNEIWECREGLYPQISEIKTNKSLLYATPIYLSNGETINNILSDFRVSILNGVVWTSKYGLVEIDSEGNVTILSPGEDVLVSKLGEYTREINIRIIDEPNINGVGTSNNPYKIANAAEFLNVAKLINSGTPLYDKLCYKVTGNIVLNDKLLDKIERNDTIGLVKWTPIKRFSGVFDFDLWFVKGLYINSTEDKQGLFESNDGEIRGAYLYDSYVKGKNETSGICCENNGLIKQCIIQKCIISGFDNTAGICSKNNGEIYQSRNQSTILGGTWYVGGISAFNKGIISNCRNDGSITGLNHIGGIIGKSAGNTDHCVNSGDIICKDGQYIGGIAGSAVQGQIKYCINSGNLNGKYFVGGITSFTNFVDLSNCYNIGSIICDNDSSLAGAITSQCLPATKDCYYDIQTSCVRDSYATGLTTLEMTTGELFNDCDNWYEEAGCYPGFSSSYLSVSHVYPIFLSNNETVNNVCSDFTINSTVSYISKNNRVQFDSDGNAIISSVGEDTIIINNSRYLPITITENPNEIIEPNKYYTLCDENNRYLSANNKTLAMIDCEDYSTIFYLDKGNELLSYINGLYINKNAEFDGIGQNGVAANFKNGSKEGTVLVGLSKNLCLGSNGYEVALAESNWGVEEATTLPVTITSAGYATFYAPVEVTVPDGVAAYYITSAGIKDGYVLLTMIEDGVIPANTGVILATETPAIYDLLITKTGAGVVEDNLLKGSAAATKVSEAAYVLYNDNGDVGLYLAEMNQNNNTAFKNNSHKAYLPVNALPATMCGSASFRFAFAGLTAVDNVEAESGEVGIFYDLMGRKIDTPIKGIYIVNGKKQIVK